MNKGVKQDSDRADGSESQKHGAVVLLFASSLYVTSAVITSSLPLMAEEFSSLPSAEILVKLALTLPTLFIALISPLTGKLSDLWGRKKILFWGLIIYGIGGSSGFYLQDIRLILLGRGLLGLGLGTTFTMASALIGDFYSGDRRRRLLGLQGAFVSLGGMIFVGGAGFLAEISWRTPFLVYLLSFLILPAAAKLKEPPRFKPAVLEESKRKRNPVGLILFIYLSVFFCMIFLLMIHTQLPFVLKQQNRSSTSLMGGILILLNLASFFTASFYHKIRRYLSSVMIYGLYFVLMGAGFILIGLKPGPLGLLGGILLCGLGTGLAVPNTSVWLQDISIPESRGQIMGYMTASAFLGQFLSPLLLQPILMRLPEGTLFFRVGISVLILGIGYGILNLLSKLKSTVKKTTAVKNLHI
jgi:MFS family permease